MIFFTIDHIIIDGITYYVDNLVEKRINDIFELERLSKSNSSNKRRFHFKIVEYIHVLIDITEKSRFSLTTVFRKYNVTSKKKMLTGAVVDGINYGKAEIKEIGSKVHSIILNEFEFQDKPNEFVLGRGNTEIMTALLE